MAGGRYTASNELNLGQLLSNLYWTLYLSTEPVISTLLQPLGTSTAPEPFTCPIVMYRLCPDPHALGTNTASPLTDLKYTEQHEWVRMDGTIGTVGITAKAAVSGASPRSYRPRQWWRAATGCKAAVCRGRRVCHYSLAPQPAPLVPSPPARGAVPTSQRSRSHLPFRRSQRSRSRRSVCRQFVPVMTPDPVSCPTGRPWPGGRHAHNWSPIDRLSGRTCINDARYQMIRPRGRVGWYGLWSLLISCHSGAGKRTFFSGLLCQNGSRLKLDYVGKENVRIRKLV